MPLTMQSDEQLNVVFNRQASRIKASCMLHMQDLMLNERRLSSIQLRESDVPVRIIPEPSMSMIGSSSGMLVDQCERGEPLPFAGGRGRPAKV